ncbi:hypothetical protein RintRC_6750 [Richelia intracellularis]|nr:hypothetical protein RintRC_6750 [Richelia intracellularis]
MPGETTSSVVALSLGQIAESDSQQDPTFKTSLAYTRLTATSALEKLNEQGFSPFDAIALRQYNGTSIESNGLWSS